jgi:hypothetical protein
MHTSSWEEAGRWEGDARFSIKPIAGSRTKDDGGGCGGILGYLIKPLNINQMIVEIRPGY